MLGGVSLLSDSNRSQIIPGLESSQKTRHKKSASNVEDITRSQRVKDQSPAPARPNKASTQPSHRRIRSTHVSPIRSAAVEVSAMLPTGAVNTGKHVDNFGRVTNDNTIKEGSRRFSDRQKDLRALMKALHAQQIQNQRKIHKNYLQRRERGDVSVLANISQENVQNNSVITPKIAHNDDHSQLFDAKTKSLQKRTDQLDFSSRQKNTSHTKTLSQIVDIVFENNKPERFTGNHVLHSMFQNITGNESRSRHANESYRLFDNSQDREMRVESTKSKGKTVQGAHRHHFPAPFGRDLNEKGNSSILAKRNSHMDIGHSLSRRSSQGHISLEPNSVRGSKENSPRPLSRDKEPTEISGLKKSLSDKRRLKLTDHSFHLAHNESMGSTKNIKLNNPSPSLAQKKQHGKIPNHTAEASSKLNLGSGKAQDKHSNNEKGISKPTTPKTGHLINGNSERVIHLLTMIKKSKITWVF